MQWLRLKQRGIILLNKSDTKSNNEEQVVKLFKSIIFIFTRVFVFSVSVNMFMSYASILKAIVGTIVLMVIGLIWALGDLLLQEKI